MLPSPLPLQNEKKMKNAMMVTSNESYGMTLPRALSLSKMESDKGGASNASNVVNDNKGCGALPGMAEESKATQPQDMSFLYSRESDRFGEGSTFSDSALSQVFRLKPSDSMNKRRKNSAFVKQLGSRSNNNGSSDSASKIVPKEEVNEILSQYDHNPKEQNPLYVTTANEYGRKRPTQATYQNVRHGMSQKFSQSFNRTMFRDEGLNSAMTRSNIHDSLTPLFV